MLFASIYAGENRFSHTPMRALGHYLEGEYSRSQILAQVEDYKNRFAAKRFSSMKVVVVEVDVMENTVEVLENLDLKNELAKRTVINPSKKERPERVKPTVYQPVGPQMTWAAITDFANAAVTQAG